MPQPQDHALTQGRSSLTPAPARGSSTLWYRIITVAVLAAASLVMAAVRLRTSPLYPRANAVNSDFYVYQIIGNSWRFGTVPYTQIFDAKGPFLYVLFLIFAWIRPWSALPAMTFLALLALGSTLVVYRIARLADRSRPSSVLAALIAGAIIYLSPANVASSFTPEEVAVPAILLLLWLTLRLMRDDQPFPTILWLVDAFAAAMLFWIKFTVVVPWIGILIALLVYARRDRGKLAAIGKVVVVHVIALAITSLILLAIYFRQVGTALNFYFFSKRGDVRLSSELSGEVHFAGQLLLHDTPTVLAMVAVLVVFVWRAGRALGREAWVIGFSFLLTTWASLAFVRHPNNVFVPLAFAGVAVAWIIPPTLGRLSRLGLAAALAVATAGACWGSLVQSHREFHLLAASPALTCYRQPSHTRVTVHDNVADIFATTADGSQILSPDSLFSARTAVIARLPMRLKYQFVDPSWARQMGATTVQTQYLKDRTFSYVWMHVKGLKPTGDITAQLLAQQPHDAQSSALAANYTPVLSCINEVLYRAR